MGKLSKSQRNIHKQRVKQLVKAVKQLVKAANLVNKFECRSMRHANQVQLALNQLGYENLCIGLGHNGTVYYVAIVSAGTPIYQRLAIPLSQVTASGGILHLIK